MLDMALFKSSKMEGLERANERMLRQIHQLIDEKCELDLKLFRAYSGELVNEITEKLELSDLQKSKLAFIFSIEHARIMGVPEYKILHDKSEIDAFFTGGS